MKPVPPRIVPPEKPLSRLAFAARFVKNPLEVVPREAYQAEFFRQGEGAARAWIMGPDLLKAVLLDEHDKFRKLTQIRLLSPLLGHGLLTSEGAEWKWQRQACAPMFRHHDLLGFVPMFVHAAQGLLAHWRTAADSVQAIDRDVTRATFEVISATLLPSANATIGPVLEHSIASRGSGRGHPARGRDRQPDGNQASRGKGADETRAAGNRHRDPAGRCRRVKDPTCEVNI